MSVGLLVLAALANSAPESDLWPRWQKKDNSSTIRVDHTIWQEFLDTYLVFDHPSGVNRMHYGSVTQKDKHLLTHAESSLAAKLEDFEGNIDYENDRRLNGP